MPTIWSKTLIPTGRQVPADAEVPSHQLMLRAGMIHRLGSGIYSYLPLGWRSLAKVTQIIRDQMNRAGAVEVLLPALQPIELWETTHRRQDYGQTLFVVIDRHGREHALGPTHEEVVTQLIAACVHSYRDLPITLYQIQTKFRDEFRPRFGVLRSREFQMKDAYSFDLTVEGLQRSYEAMYEAYCQIFARCGLPYQVVEAESGPIGGSASHEFMVPSPTGEDLILRSDKGNYAANVQKCEIGPRSCQIEAQASGPLQRVHTPDCHTIDQVCGLLACTPAQVLKTLVYAANWQAPAELGSLSGQYLLVVVRGDHDANEAKVAGALSAAGWHLTGLQLAGESAAGDFAIGYVGPHAFCGRTDCLLVADADAVAGESWVAGANDADHHVTCFNWQRDVVAGRPMPPTLLTGDFRNAVDGDPSPRNDGGTLRATRGIEVGHVFKLGTKYTEALGVSVLGPDNMSLPVIMGCYGIGANRILAAAIECQAGHDDNGIIWPPALAPYTVLITQLGDESQAQRITGELAARIEENGLDVLIDDRNERPGVKFKDADLIGIPLRITVGPRRLKQGQVELKRRHLAEGTPVDIDQAAAAAGCMLAS